MSHCLTLAEGAERCLPIQVLLCHHSTPPHSEGGVSG